MIRQFAYSANGNIIRLATMAGFAISRDTRVYVLCVLKWRWVGADSCISVAGRTVLRCRQVINCLAGTYITVMARRAVSSDSSMIKSCGYKGRGFVTVTAITVGWQVVNKFTNSDHIIMTIRTKRRWINVTWTMTEDAASESTGGMANTAVLVRRHMVGRFTHRGNTVTGIAPVTHDVTAGMIDERADESIGVMTTTTIRLCLYMFGYRG